MVYSDIMNLWFYDLEYILKSYQAILEERQKAEEEQAKKQGYDPSKYSPDSMMKSVKGSMPKMPSMPSMNGFKL